jgi:hypothetical protein
MSRRIILIVVCCAAAFVAAAVGASLYTRNASPPPDPPDTIYSAPPRQVRKTLHALVQPVKLSNCELKRFGEAHDGGYLVCANLLNDVKAGYSYGISGYDKWGCDISSELKVPVHQYDCFNPKRPVCTTGKTIFHDECVAGTAFVDSGRPFDTIEGQLAKNGDGSVHVVMKMDVEGAEWESLLKTPDAVLQRIDQLSIELHGVNEYRFVPVLKKLHQFFYVANLHYNNWSCKDGLAPFPAWAYEVLWVNKRIGVVDSSSKPQVPNPLDAPNNADTPDCQSPVEVASGH